MLEASEDKKKTLKKTLKYGMRYYVCKVDFAGFFLFPEPYARTKKVKKLCRY